MYISDIDVPLRVGLSQIIYTNRIAFHASIPSWYDDNSSALRESHDNTMSYKNRKNI